MSKSVVGLFVVLAAIAAIVAGCGGGGDSTEGTAAESTAALTKAAFIKKANAVCEKESKKILAAAAKLSSEKHYTATVRPSRKDVIELVEEVVLPTVKSEVEQIRALGAPSGEEQKVDQVMTAVEEAIEEGEEHPYYVSEDNAGPFAKSNKVVVAYGLADCAR